MRERAPCIYVIAGESSGDKIAGGIMRAMREARPDVEFYGIGGPEMLKAGLKQSLFPFEELSLMGFAEILPKMYHLLARIGSTVDDVQYKQPDIIMTVDSPGFTFRVVRKLRELNVKSTFVHVVAPTVWAYKPERAQKCAKLFDHMLVLLPFEPPYFEKEGLKTTYIGHPTVWKGNPEGNGKAFRERHRIAPDTPIFALLPGSRENEIKRHMWLMSQAINQLSLKHKFAPIIVSVAAEHTRAMMTEFFASSPFRNILVFDTAEKMDALAAANIALVKSGTITLEVAYAGTPMIVTYRVHPISAWIVRKLINISQVSLINILQNTEVIPEFLQENATVPNLSKALEALWTSPEQQQFQRAQFAQAIDKLQPQGGNNPCAIAAATILSNMTQDSH